MHTVPPWQKKLISAITGNKAVTHSRYFQLATIDAQGIPNCRTMVFRGFGEGSDTLVMHTDLRSDKIQPLKYQNTVEVCWYFPLTREQFRLQGKIELIDSPEHPQEALRKGHWHELSDDVRAAYTPFAISENMPAPKLEERSQHSPSEYFALLQLITKRVDHLQLSPLPHRRSLYQKDNQNCWQSSVIQP
ncbi:MAG: pyridoxamine 5'-phosphate oxidase [Paraglaciecola sp.]|jgi:pyridoxamine 5'-phosphate oxidase